MCGLLSNQIEIYQTLAGKSPFVQWVESIRDKKTINIVQKRIGLLRLGNLGDFKFFDGIYELRIDYGPGSRIYCGKKDKRFICPFWRLKRFAAQGH